MINVSCNHGGYNLKRKCWTLPRPSTGRASARGCGSKPAARCAARPCCRPTGGAAWVAL